jgi:TPP-dependent pyruvate/acetoin dehydrogenase alpha subunit
MARTVSQLKKPFSKRSVSPSEFQSAFRKPSGSEKKTPAQDVPEDYSLSPFNARLTQSEKIRLLREMLRIRRFEQQALKHYNNGDIGGFLHLYIGEESVAVGAVSLMSGQDEIITTYRDHGHALAVGMGMNECMAELFGKQTGCSKGKGGSLHFFAPEKHYWGGHGIVGGQTPLGMGLAFALKYKGIKGCALTFLGDGAVNQGIFSECLNMASLFELPVVFVIENNGYSMGTSLARSSALHGSLASRAEGFCVDWSTCGGFEWSSSRSSCRRDSLQEKSRGQHPQRWGAITGTPLSSAIDPIGGISKQLRQVPPPRELDLWHWRSRD